MVPDEVATTTEQSTEERRKAGLTKARAVKASLARDRADREVYEKRIREIVLAERPDLDPEEIELTFTGDLTDCVIHLPDQSGDKNKKAYRLKEGVRYDPDREEVRTGPH